MKIKNQEYIENDYVKYWIEDGIIHADFKGDSISLNMAKKIVHDRLKLSNSVTMPILIYSNNVTTIDKDARDYFTSKEATQYLSASAMIINNYITWLLGKLLLAFHKPELTVELFRNNKKALNWLSYYKNLN